MEASIVIGDARVARALTLGDMINYLQPFVHAETTVADAARHLGEPIQRVHYRVQRLVDLGLLEVTTVEARAGRPIKRYRATAYVYRIPATILPEQLFPLSEANRSAFMQRALEAARPELVHDGEMRITFLPDGSVNTDRLMGGDGLETMLGERAPAVVSTFRNLYLGLVEAKQLQLELWDLLQRYSERYSAPGQGRRHMIHVTMAPEPPEIDHGVNRTTRRRTDN